MQVRHRRVECEVGIEAQSRRGAVQHQSPVATKANPVRITNGSHGAEAIKCAAEHDDKHARIAAFGARELRKLGPRKQGAGADQCLAATCQVRASSHCHLLWNSADMNNRASACWRVSARATAWWVSGEIVDASTVSMIRPGSTLPAMRSA